MAKQREGGIGWTSETWNPVRGCSRVSAGCEHCYAESVAARFSGVGQPYEGLARRAPNGEPRWTGTVRLVPEMLDQPLRWKRPRRIFVNSMSDLFHESLDVEVIDEVLAVMLLAPHHTFQVLTKRAERMRDYLSDVDLYERVVAAADRHRQRNPQLATVGISNPTTHPAPWIWWGNSIEHQEAADERVPLLLRTPAAVRFLSIEPLLGPVNLTNVGEYDGRPLSALKNHPCVDDEPGGIGIDWVIVGGESGPKARPMNPQWARDLRDQCVAAGVPFFFKQWGDVRVTGCALPESPWKQAGLDVREKKGGRELDGRTWDEMPSPRGE